MTSDRIWDGTAAAMFFDGRRLTLARQLSGIRKSDLATRLNKSATAVSAWESGAKRPTPATVTELALALSVDASFFAVRAESVVDAGTVPHFRSLRSTTQLARDQAFAFGQAAVDVAWSLERHVEFPPVDLPRIPVLDDDLLGDGPEQAARQVRHAWGLGTGPLRHAVRLLENHGVLVVFSPPQTASVDAYSFETRLRPVVLLNPVKLDYYRQRFDAAHELGHLVMHADAEPGGRIVEEQAHRFAAEFLAPSSELINFLPRAMNRAAWITLAKLKERWGLSIQALLHRARRLGTLSDVSYRNAMTTISARGWRRDEPGQITSVEQPSLIPRAVELLAGESIHEDVLVAECGVPRNLFRVVASRTPTAPLEASVDPPISGRVVSLLRERADHGEREEPGRWSASIDPDVQQIRQPGRPAPERLGDFPG